jgi:hypothetical protein
MKKKTRRKMGRQITIVTNSDTSRNRKKYLQTIARIPKYQKKRILHLELPLKEYLDILPVCHRTDFVQMILELRPL